MYKYYKVLQHVRPKRLKLAETEQELHRVNEELEVSRNVLDATNDRVEALEAQYRRIMEIKDGMQEDSTITMLKVILF